MSLTGSEASKPAKHLHIRFPQQHGTSKNIDQDEETCEIVEGDKVTTVRFHNYAQVFSIPGLYNQLFGGSDSETKCVSPQVIAILLNEHLPSIQIKDSTSEAGTSNSDQQATTPNTLRILDFGAGNGMIGEEIRHTVHPDKTTWQDIFILGWDILPEAKAATARDRPGIYNDYIAADINKHASLTPADGPWTSGFHVLTTASALSFGDATVNAFKAATSLVLSGGLLVFNLNEKFLDIASMEGGKAGEDASSVKLPSGKRDGFLGMISDAIDAKSLTILETKRYRHRFSVTGRELYYVAVVAIKHSDLR